MVALTGNVSLRLPLMKSDYGQEQLGVKRDCGRSTFEISERQRHDVDARTAEMYCLPQSGR